MTQCLSELLSVVFLQSCSSTLHTSVCCAASLRENQRAQDLHSSRLRGSCLLCARYCNLPAEQGELDTAAAQRVKYAYCQQTGPAARSLLPSQLRHCPGELQLRSAGRARNGSTEELVMADGVLGGKRSSYRRATNQCTTRVAVVDRIASRCAASATSSSAHQNLEDAPCVRERTHDVHISPVA